MFDNIVSNKYFVIALVIALIVVIYLYSRKKSCAVEGMQNVDLTLLAPEISEKPWADDDNDGNYKNVNKRFDKYADAYAKRKSGKNSNLKRKDQLYNQYMEYEGYEDVIPEKIRQKRKRMVRDNIPKPLDDRPDLSQCQPCICPQDRLMAIDDDDDNDDDDDYDENIYIPSKKNNYRTPKRKLNL
jgi:hypothetical protein